MTPLHATITGAKGILAGLGRETLTLNLEEIPDDAVSVYIRGDNGSGKSTLMNLALVPWREPPQLTASVYDEFGPTGLRELTWEHADRTFRSRIEYKQTSKTKSQKAFLHVSVKSDDDFQWTPYKMADNTVSDGKSSTYDACLEDVLGPRDIYYLSAFRAQGAEKLGDYDDPKGLMRALLDLEEPEVLRERCREVVRGLNGHCQSLSARISSEDHQHAINELAVRDVQLATTISKLNAEQSKQSKAVAMARAELDQAAVENIVVERLLDQRSKVQEQIGNARREHNQRITQINGDIAAVRAQIESERKRSDQMLEQVSTGERVAGADLAKCEELIARRDEIEQASEDLNRVQFELDDKEASMDALRVRWDALQDIAMRMRDLDSKADAKKQHCEHLDQRLEELTLRAGFIAKVPCRGEGEYSSCPALREAMNASEDVILVETEIAASKIEQESIEEQILSLVAESSDTETVRADIKETQTIINQMKARLEALRETAAEKLVLEKNDERLVSIREQLAGFYEQREQILERRDQAISDLNVQLANLASRSEQESAEGEDRIQALTDKLASLPEPTQESILQVAQDALEREQKRHQEITERKADAIGEKANNKARMEQMRQQAEETEKQKAEVARIQHEISDWTLLGIALRGIVDLSIEAAGPSIATLANNLLTQAYGPRFSVRIVTQRQQANGRLVECFDISVIDSETGFESSIVHKSGGESVWLDKALTDAVGLYHQDAAGVKYECLFADEAEDGLTAERKAQFYAMDRAMLKLGGYSRKYVVSHNPDAWAQADHVIDLESFREG